MSFNKNLFRNINWGKHFENFFYSEMEYRFKEMGLAPKGGQYSGAPSLGGLLNSVFHSMVDLSSKKLKVQRINDYEDLIKGSVSAGMRKDISEGIFGNMELPKEMDQLNNFTIEYFKPAVCVFWDKDFDDDEVHIVKLRDQLVFIRDNPFQATLPMSIHTAPTPTFGNLMKFRNNLISSI